MRQVSRAAYVIAAFAALTAADASQSTSHAQLYGGGYPYNYANQTYSYGLTLPQVPQPNGQDEIRAADGTSCRSSMASNNAYLDVGGMGGQDSFGTFNSGTVYGRVIIPLGEVPKRVDCTSLYNLEIERLRRELELTKEGLMGNGQSLSSAPIAGGQDKAWAQSGWSTPGDTKSAKASDPAKGKTSFAAPAAPPTAVASAIDGVIPSHLGGPRIEEAYTEAQPPAPAVIPIVRLKPKARPHIATAPITTASIGPRNTLKDMFAAAIKSNEEDDLPQLPNYAAGLVRVLAMADAVRRPAAVKRQPAAQPMTMAPAKPVTFAQATPTPAPKRAEVAPSEGGEVQRVSAVVPEQPVMLPRVIDVVTPGELGRPGGWSD